MIAPGDPPLILRFKAIVFSDRVLLAGVRHDVQVGRDYLFVYSARGEATALSAALSAALRTAGTLSRRV